MTQPAKKGYSIHYAEIIDGEIVNETITHVAQIKGVFYSSINSLEEVQLIFDDYNSRMNLAFFSTLDLETNNIVTYV